MENNSNKLNATPTLPEGRIITQTFLCLLYSPQTEETHSIIKLTKNNNIKFPEICYLFELLELLYLNVLYKIFFKESESYAVRIKVSNLMHVGGKVSNVEGKQEVGSSAYLNILYSNTRDLKVMWVEKVVKIDAWDVKSMQNPIQLLLRNFLRLGHLSPSTSKSFPCSFIKIEKALTISYFVSGKINMETKQN